MSDLQHIQYRACPDCGSPFSSLGRETDHWRGEGTIRRHINGEMWEWIQFTCGRKDAYIPNFQKIETERPCGNSASEVEKRRKREEAKVKIGEFLSTLDVDAEGMSEILTTIRFRL